MGRADDCGTKAYNIITGKFDHEKFDQCFMQAMDISHDCADCYAASGDHAATNCKADCLLGWCKQGCLDCTEPAQEALSTCTGFTTPTADPCEETMKEEVRGVCDRPILVVGDELSQCAGGAFDVITGKFDGGKF